MSIDAVISWVDGYDPVYQEKLKVFCSQQGIEPTSALEPTRIQQQNEIHYCLHALRRFAPWIRTIYLITNQQIPSTVKSLKNTDFGHKIKIIDQNDLLQQANVKNPIFNSLSIEWLIWKIKGLSKHFLYLNDDFFIIRNLQPEDFFRNNCMVLRGEWKAQLRQKWHFRLKQLFTAGFKKTLAAPKTNAHRAWQEKSAQLAGWDKRFYLLPHAPFPLIKTTFENWLSKNSDAFEKNVGYPFRHPDQVSSVPLMVHLDIKSKRIHYDSRYQSIMVNGAHHSFKKIQSRLDYAQKSSNVAFVCMQSLDQASQEVREYMMEWLKINIEK